MRLLSPREEFPTVFDIDYGSLWGRGIRGLIFDLDNTLCPWRAPALDEATVRLLEGLRARGFRLCVLSNGRLEGRGKVVEDLSRRGIPLIYPAGKPLPFAFNRARECLGLSPSEIAVIGDQLLTDILGGNIVGFHTILVEPLDPHEHPWTRFVARSLERLLGRRVRRRSAPAGGDRGYPGGHRPPGSRRDRRG
ncbi:MAG: YqeG family HAD IIIA-type phosphatase [Caldiserica bacterium]|nr:YqeG family HAD IIIA-type phosphatase [Caldisericota bacterium]